MVDFVEGALVTYSYHLMPSGSGTRIFVYAAAPTNPDGTPRPELAESEYRTAWHDLFQGNMDRLTAMADAAAAALQDA